MRPVLTPNEMAAADRAAIASGTSESVLIDRAGRALARCAIEALGGTYGRRVVVLAGPGNNGADGLVAGRRLAARRVGVDVIHVPLRDPWPRVERWISRADLVIDAMFGTGLARPLTDEVIAIVELLRGRRVLAADIPSGIDGATGYARPVAATAERTVCFQALKPGLLFEPGRARCGVVDVVDLAIPVSSTVFAVDRGDVERLERDAAAHKWSTSVLVVGGSSGMTGAPMLAARAAQRSGAGMVVVALAGAAAARAGGAEVVTRRFDADPDGSFAVEAAGPLLEATRRFGAVVLGPGISDALGPEMVVGSLTAAVDRPIVIDADALGHLGRDSAALRVRHAAGLVEPVLTPHAGEYERLAGRPVGDDRIGAARDLAARLHAVVLLKGPGTVVAAPNGQVRVVVEGDSSLATAGTGDVLAGMIGAALAAGRDPFTAAWTSAVVHGVAGRRSPHGPGTIASDLIAALPVAWGV